jgi:tetratricopeptide (TPR) repeat protein
MSDTLTSSRFIRSVGLSIEDEGLRFSHDYGEVFFPWQSISHAFSVLLKKKATVNLPLFIFTGEDARAIYYIDGNTMALKMVKTAEHADDYSIPSVPQSIADARRSKEEDFKKIIRDICAHFSTTYIDKPLIAYLKGNRFFLPEFTTLKDIADYVTRIKDSVTGENLKGAQVLEEEADLKEVETPREERKEWTPGSVIEDVYTVQEVLRGGMGTVYIVFDSQNVDFYALKTFQEAYLWDEKVVRQFIKEAEIWVNLERHPHIVQAQKVKLIEGKPYLFLEYITGTDLGRLLDRKPLTLGQSLEFAIQFCEGMDYAFRKLGLIHRDIKPANCMITREGVLKITDFGLGKLRTEQQSPGGQVMITGKTPVSRSFSATMGMAGTLPFMAPELFSEEGEAGIKSDIYAFGIVLYMMLIGSNPFNSDSPSKILSNHISLQPDSPRSLKSEVPLELSELVMKCLNKEPDERYESFEDIRKELQIIYRAATGGDYIPLVVEDTFSEDDWLNKGLSLDSLGRFNEAVLTFDRVLSLHPGSIKALIYKGRSLLNSGKAREALSCMGKGMKLAPENWELWFYSGESLWKLNDTGRALPCFDRALELAGQDSVILGRKGKLLYELDRHSDALACYDAALSLNPRAADIWSEKGNLLISMGQSEAAIDCINQSLEINPRSRDALYNQGRALLSLGFFSKAISGLEKCLAIDRDFADAWLIMGDCHREYGNNDEALNSYRRALEIRPGSLEPYLRCIELEKETGDFEEARELIEKALSIEPTNPRLHLERAYILFRLGYLDAARDLCEQMRAGEGDNDEAKLLNSAISRWLYERDALFERIFATPPLSVSISYSNFNDLLSIFCDPDAALAYLRKSDGYAYLRACIYFVQGRNEDALQNIEVARARNDNVEGLTRLRKLVDEQALRETQPAPQKRGFFGTLFKKPEPCPETEKENVARTAEEMLLLGLCRMREGHYSDARDRFRNALELDPAYHSCRFFIGKAYDLEGKHLKAFYNYDDFSQHVPQSLGFWKVRLATSSISNPLEAEAIYHRWIGGFRDDWDSWTSYFLYLAENDYSEKIFLLASGLLDSSFTDWKNHESSSQYWNMKGILRLFLRRFKEAEVAFSRSLEIKPGDVTALLGIGKSLEGMKRRKEAIEHFKQIIGKDEESLKGNEVDYEDAFVGASYLLASLHTDEKFYEKALVLVERALTKYPDSLLLKFKKAHILACAGKLQEFVNYCSQISISQSQFTAIRVLRSANLAENHKLDDATAEMLSMLSVGTINLVVLKNLGYTYIQSMNPGKALPAFEKMQSIYTMDFEVWMGKGMASYLLRDLDDAGESFDRALEVDPVNADLCQFMAAVKFHRGELTECRKYLERALAFRSHFAQGWSNMAVFHCQTGDYIQAQECTDRALRIDSELCSAWLCRAQCQWKTENMQEAIKSVQKALSIAPQNPRAWILHGALEFYAGTLDISFQSFDRAVHFDKQNCVAWSNRALVSLHMKNMPEARRSIDRALALNARHFGALVARYIFERGFSAAISEDAYLTPAREADPERFKEWMDEFHRTGDPLAPLKPLESTDDPFTLPYARSTGIIEPLQLMNYPGARQVN